jgi:hypothetical protein
LVIKHTLVDFTGHGQKPEARCRDSHQHRHERKWRLG